VLFMLMSIGCDYVSELRSPMGLLFIPQVVYEYGDERRNDIDREIRRTRKNSPSAILSTTNPTCIEPVANPGRRGERPMTNGLSYGTDKEGAYLRHELRP
jgi:hypothetical protein